MSQVVVDTDTGEILTDMNADEAWEFVQFIRDAQDEVPRRISDAYNRRAWLALGYESWDEMCVGERLQIRLPRAERPELVLELRAGGMSTRAIASVTGTGVGTVHRDLDAGVPFGTPADGDDFDDDSEPESDAEPESYQDWRCERCNGVDSHDHDDPEDCHCNCGPETDCDKWPRPVTGLDGKSYRPNSKPKSKPAEPAQPKRPDITKTFFNAAYDLNRRAESLSRIVDDDRFGRNKNQLAEKHLHELAVTRDLIDEVITHLKG